MSAISRIAVIYKSVYGTTKQYAEWISQELGASLLEASTVQPSQLTSYDVVIYGGGLYAGGITGVDLVTKNPCNLQAVFTVGLANPDSTDYSPILEQNFSKEMLSKTKVFHLRGGIDYKKLGLIHRGMMAMKHKSVQKIEESMRTDEDEHFLETYGSKIYFTDKSTIAPILEYIKPMSTG